MTNIWKIIPFLLPFLFGELEVGQGALLYSEIAEGLCRNLNAFLDSKSLAPKLEEQHVTPRIAPSLFRFTKCRAGRSCTPFKYASTRESMKVRAGEPRAPPPPPNLPPYERKVMVELRNQYNCQPEYIGCVANCDGPNGRRRRSAEEEKDAGLTLEQKLRKHAKETQADVLKILNRKSRSMGFEVETVWIMNMLFITGSDVETVKELLKDREDVKDIRLEEVYSIPPPTREVDPGPETRGNAPWWHEIMDVPKLHAMGIDGKGVVVGNIDSGVDGLHYALKDNFRGGDYAWFDPYYKVPTPQDSDIHGSHVMGIMVGKNGLGVAPGAKWIACRACYGVRYCAGTAGILCNQWFLCPTRTNGSDPNCSKKAQVVNNSWGADLDASSGYAPNYLEPSLKCLRQAGVIPVYSAGNAGPYCGKHGYGAASPQVLAIGNVARNYKGPLKGTMAYSSSRGPVHASYGKHIKPDFSAPGTQIRSSVPGNQLMLLSGTSMASPQVSGVIALMFQRNPSLTFNGVKTALIESCGPVYVNYDRGCGRTSSLKYPNFEAGWGLINAYKAVFANASALLPTWTPPNGTLPASTRRRKRRSTTPYTGTGTPPDAGTSEEDGSTLPGPPYTGPPTFATRGTLIPRNYTGPTTLVPGNGTQGTGGTGAPGTGGTGAPGTGGTGAPACVPTGNTTCPTVAPACVPSGNTTCPTVAPACVPSGNTTCPTGGPAGTGGTGGTGGPTTPLFTAFTRFTRPRLITKEFTGPIRPIYPDPTTTGRYDPLQPRGLGHMRPRSFRQFY